jgi:translation initiation factor IF-2
MSGVSQRLSKVAKEFNVGVDTILDFLESKGIDNLNRNSKISPETYEVLVDEYQPDKKVKAEAKELKKAEDDLKPKVKKEIETVKVEAPKMEGLKIVSTVDITPSKTVEPEVKKKEVEPEKVEAPVVEKADIEPPKTDEPKAAEEVKVESKEPAPTEKKEAEATEEKKAEEPSIIRGRAKKLDGPTLVSSEKIDLTKFQKPKKKKPCTWKEPSYKNSF